jgi:hypothetical protein
VAVGTVGAAAVAASASGAVAVVVKAREVPDEAPAWLARVANAPSWSYLTG